MANKINTNKREISPLSDMSKEDVERLIETKTNLIDGILIFDEFMKEYTFAGKMQKRNIRLMSLYRQVYDKDQELDETLKRQRRIVKRKKPHQDYDQY